VSCKILVLYWSKGGNTHKVAETIHTTIQDHGLSSEILEIKEDLEIDVFSYELIFLGAPVYFNLAPQPVMKFLQRLRRRAKKLAAAPEKPGHFAVVFCTFAGGHTGIGEAVPLVKYMGQVFEHEGIRVVEEWPVVGDFPGIGDPYYNTAGRLGDVTGRPNVSDLRVVAGLVSGLLRRLQYKLGIEALVGMESVKRV
jgi:flavodoxin